MPRRAACDTPALKATGDGTIRLDEVKHEVATDTNRYNFSP
jgi:hypothetical protein